MELKNTPLIEEHRALSARLGPFGGWLMPIQYSGIIAEHEWTRTKASLFDICHMGEFFIKGGARETGLDRLFTADIVSLEVNKCRYGFLLSETGGILDDVIIYRLEDTSWMAVVNAATAGQDAQHFRKHLSAGASFEDASGKLGKFDLQGPASEAILCRFCGPEISRLSYYGFGYFNFLGERTLISRTGYTGERGYELYIPADRIVRAWRSLLENEHLRPAGLGARDTLRLEMGYPLYGQDISIETTPLDAGLEKFVDFSKDFLGKPALLEQKERGVGRHLVYFVTKSRKAPRHEFIIRSMEHRDLGVVTSGSFSPSLACGIGMGYVSAELKEKESILISDGKTEMEAAVARKPFYRKGTAR